MNGGLNKHMVIEVECITAKDELGRKVFTYNLEADGEKLEIKSDKSLTMEELREKLED